MYYVKWDDIAEAVKLVAQRDGASVASAEGNAKGNVVVKTTMGNYVVDVKAQKVWKLLDWRLGIWEEVL